MIRVDLLRKSIADNGLTLRWVAEGLGISTRALSARLKKGVFRSDQMEQLIVLLRLENPSEVFFDIKPR